MANVFSYVALSCGVVVWCKLGVTTIQGKLVVAGGEGVGRGGKQFLDDMEIFDGKKWVTSKQKLDRPRSGFSLLKIPKKKRSSRRKPK